MYIRIISVGSMAKTTYLDEDDRKLLFETKQKLDEATKLMGELMETIEKIYNVYNENCTKKGVFNNSYILYKNYLKEDLMKFNANPNS